MNGKLLTGEPATTGVNYKTLQNIRYTDTHLKGVAGTTKINTAPLPATYQYCRDLFHFSKYQPEESHLLAQIFDGYELTSQIVDSTNTIPNAGNFNELLTLDVAPVSATVLLLHGDATPLIDSASGAKTVTAVGNAAYSTAQKKFGTGSIYFDGTGGYLTVPDSADWYFGADPFTIDTWVRFNDSTNLNMLARQYVNADNYWFLNVTRGGVGGTYYDGKISFLVVVGGVIKASYDTTNNCTPYIVWHHIELVRSGINVYIFVDGVSQPLTVTTAISTNEVPNLAAVLEVGAVYNNTYAMNGWLDEFRISKGVARHTANFTPPTQEYADTAWQVGTTITGLTSLSTCNIAKILSSTSYIINNRTGNFTLGEVLSCNGLLADQGAAHPTVAIYPIYTPTSLAGRGTFCNIPNGQVAFCNGINSCMWGGDEMPITAYISSTAEVGADGTATAPKDYSMQLRNTKTDSDNVCVLWASVAKYFLVGSPRPLQGVKFYVTSPNATASTLTAKVWDGDSWDSLTTVDYTSINSISLATTGFVSFQNTATTTPIAKTKYIEGYYLYWYQFTLSAGLATISHVTLDAAFQPIIDLWDGIYRSISAGFKRTTSIEDKTLNLLKEDYDLLVPDTYLNLGVMAAYSDPANTIEVGFPEKITGLYIKIPPEYTNNASGSNPCVMSVDYWGGDAYATVGDVSDGTSETIGGDAISFAKSGVVTWNNANVALETRTNKLLGTVKQTVTVPLYFYRIRFNRAMYSTGGAVTGVVAHSVLVDYIGGITVPKTMSYYKFPVFAQGRLLLCNDMSGEKNKVTCSAKYMPQVFNGEDSADVYFGDDEPLTCGIELYSQFGSNLFSLILMFKRTQIWLAAGQDISTWSQNIFPLSLMIGCPAPQTLKVLNLAAEIAQGTNRSLVIWQGTNGIYMSDGRAPIPIHSDIKEYFDTSDSRCITKEYIEYSTAFVDYEKQEYHWIFSSGVSGANTYKELVYDIHRMKWFEIVRDEVLKIGSPVTDANGNYYTYGANDSGYILILENGTSFDGHGIVHTLQTGDFAPLGLSNTSQIDKIKLLTVAKSVSATDITLSHYSDTLTTSSDMSLDQNKSGYRIANPMVDTKLQGEPFHSLKMTVTTTNEAAGIEPIALIATVHSLTED